MGTRADFYVGRGTEAEWLGSIAWDGYPDGIPAPVLTATSEADYREAVSAFLGSRDDGTTPDLGWPWPWSDSRTSDYAYAFDGGRVFGWSLDWFDATAPEPEWDDEGEYPEPTFPDMSERKAVALGPRSGLIVLQRH